MYFALALHARCRGLALVSKALVRLHTYYYGKRKTSADRTGVSLGRRIGAGRERKQIALGSRDEHFVRKL